MVTFYDLTVITGLPRGNMQVDLSLAKVPMRTVAARLGAITTHIGEAMLSHRRGVV